MLDKWQDSRIGNYRESGVEPLIDADLSGDILTLKSFFEMIGTSEWKSLAEKLDEMLPVSLNAPSILESIQQVIVPEAYRLMEISDIDSIDIANDGFWDMIHPDIKRHAYKRFKDGHYADAVESSYKEINHVIKNIVKDAQGNSGEINERDGVDLIRYALSVKKPIIKLHNNLASDDGKNTQLGYMQIMAGAMQAARNPAAHSNQDITPLKATHLIFLASLIRYTIDKRERD